MNKIITIAFLLTVLCFGVSYGSLFETGHKLSVIETENFDIIFSEDSRKTAEYIAKVAEERLAYYDKFLQTQNFWRTVVVVTSDTHIANGMYSPVPYNTIVIYDFLPQAGSSIGNYSNWMDILFDHELVHAVSLGIRSPLFFEIGAQIFGNWVLPQMYMNSGLMVEGVTVAFESLQGFGRVNDPAIRHSIQQDIVESRFKRLSQTTASYDLYPGGSIFYHYGGYFSHYLIETYGMEKYRALWHRMGQGNIFHLLPGSFRKVYGNSIRSEWNKFREFMELKTPVFTNTNVISPRYKRIRSVAAGDYKIYYYDLFNLEIRCYDTVSEADSLVLKTDSLVGSINLNDDESRMLISRNYLRNGFYKLAVVEYDLQRRRFTDFSLEGVREAIYFDGENADGIVAVRVRNSESDLVYIDNFGERVLLKGNTHTLFESPVRVDKNRVAFIVKQHGINRIGVYDFKSGKAQAITGAHTPSDLYVEFEPRGIIIPEELDKSKEYGDFTRIQYIRDISAKDGWIYFAYNNGGVYKPGLINLDKSIVNLYTNDISGGVFLPVYSGFDIYYTGKFSRGDRLMRMGKTGDGGFISYGLKKEIFNTQTVTRSEKKSFEEKRYSGARYLLPRMWMPHITASGRFDNIGIATILSDPLRANQIIPSVTYNFYNHFPNIEIYWDNSALPVNLYFDFKDNLYFVGSGKFYYRRTEGAFGMYYIYNFLRANNAIRIGTEVSYYATSFENELHPYQWTYNPGRFLLSVHTAFSSFRSKYRFFDYRGVNLQVFFDHLPEKSIAKGEFLILYSPNFLRVLLSLYGAYGHNQEFYASGHNPDFGRTRYPAYMEFSGLMSAGEYYIGGQATLPIFNIELQMGPGFFPLYFNRIYMTGGYRGIFPDNIYHHSVFLRANLELRLWYEFPLVLFFETSYDINNNEFYYGFSFNIASLFDYLADNRETPLRF
jgi:hypothetical protein